MGQTRRVSGRSTAIFTDDAGTHVVYHQTKVVTWTDTQVTLRSGGWLSATTKLRMNQTTNQFRLGFSVRQSDHEWLVTLPNGSTVSFVDGMTFDRSPS